jgi:hypothetical protein
MEGVGRFGWVTDPEQSNRAVAARLTAMASACATCRSCGGSAVRPGQGAFSGRRDRW